MLAAANKAKEKLARSVTTHSPVRTPVCTEDAAAHAALLGGSGSHPSHSLVHGGGRPPAPQPQSPSFGGGYEVGYAQYQGYPPGGLGANGYQPGAYSAFAAAQARSPRLSVATMVLSLSRGEPFNGCALSVVGCLRLSTSTLL